MTKKIAPIEKLRKIIQWADYQNESFNLKFKSIKAIENAYDYCIKNDIAFIDSEGLFEQFEGEELKKHLAYRKTLLTNKTAK